MSVGDVRERNREGGERGGRVRKGEEGEEGGGRGRKGEKG